MRFERMGATYEALLNDPVFHGRNSSTVGWLQPHDLLRYSNPFRATWIARNTANCQHILELARCYRRQLETRIKFDAAMNQDDTFDLAAN